MVLTLAFIYECSSANSPVASSDDPNQGLSVVTHNDTEDEVLIYEQYDFCWSKWYDSKQQANEPGEIETRPGELNIRYGDTMSAMESRVTWMKNGDTVV